MLNLTDLDTLRADAMRAMLTDEGRRHVWMYDVCRLRDALSEAIDRQNYDDLKTDADALREGKQYALIGPGICDCPFTTPDELIEVVRWLCTEGYLRCYQAERWRWQPHLQDDQQAISTLWAA